MITNLIEDFKEVNKIYHLSEKFPIYSQDGKGDKAQILLIYAIPDSNIFWAVTEVEVFENNVTFFGLVNLQECELGYFSLSELMQFNAEHEFPKIERINKVCPFTIAELKKMLGM